MANTKRYILLGSAVVGAGLTLRMKQRVDNLRFDATHISFKELTMGMGVVRGFAMITNHDSQDFLMINNLAIDLELSDGKGDWDYVGTSKPYPSRDALNPLTNKPYGPNQHPLDFPSRQSRQLSIDIQVNGLTATSLIQSWIQQPNRTVRLVIKAALKLPLLQNKHWTLDKVEIPVPQLLSEETKETLLSRFGLGDLGYYPTETRTHFDRSRWAKYYPPKPNRKPRMKLLGTGSTWMTIDEMMKLIHSTRWQTKKIAQALVGRTVEETLQNIYYFHVNHIKFKQDPAGKELIQQPMWLFFRGEGDCDCATTSIGTMLANLLIPFDLVKTAYERKDGTLMDPITGKPTIGYQHVYPIAKVGGKEYVMDFNMGVFGAEKKYLTIERFPYSHGYAQ